MSNPSSAIDAATGPVRTCIGCRARRSVDELRRLSVDGLGALVLDRRGAGRGAWICSASLVECFEVANQRRAFARAFRRSIDSSSIESARAELLDEDATA